MKANKIIGVALYLVAIATINGMVIQNEIFWLVYNYVLIFGGIIAGTVLLRAK